MTRNPRSLRRRRKRQKRVRLAVVMLQLMAQVVVLLLEVQAVMQAVQAVQKALHQAVVPRWELTASRKAMQVSLPDFTSLLTGGKNLMATNFSLVPAAGKHPHKKHHKPAPAAGGHPAAGQYSPLPFLPPLPKPSIPPPRSKNNTHSATRASPSIHPSIIPNLRDDGIHNRFTIRRSLHCV